MEKWYHMRKLGLHYPYGCVYLRDNKDGTWYVGSTGNLSGRYYENILENIVFVIPLPDYFAKRERVRLEYNLMSFCMEEGLELTNKVLIPEHSKNYAKLVSGGY